MPRTPGAKNKKTLEKEARAAAAKIAPLLAQKEAPAEAAAKPVAPPIAKAAPETVPDEKAYPAPHDEDRTEIVARRACLAVCLNEAVDKSGATVDELYLSVLASIGGVTAQTIRADVQRLLMLKLAEERPPKKGGAPSYMATLKLERSLEALTPEAIALGSLVGEDEPKAPEAPPAPAGDAGRPPWAAVTAASAAKEAEEKASAIGKRRKKKGSDADPQLGLGSGPGRFTMELPCPVADDELRDLQERHLSILDRADALEMEKSDAVKGFAKRRDALDVEEHEVRGQLREARSGNRLASVECGRRLDGSTMRIVRIDTGEIVEERAATAAELQAPDAPPPLGGVPAAPAPDPRVDVGDGPAVLSVPAISIEA